MVDLRKITKDNNEECFALKVADRQMNFVPSNIYSLAQAWVFQDTSFPFAIYDDNIMVGFIMLGYYEIKSYYTVWRLMVDKNYQNKGYGRKALAHGVNFLIDNFKVAAIFLSVDPENNIARSLYRSLGFIETGEYNGREIGMKLTIHNSFFDRPK